MNELHNIPRIHTLIIMHINIEFRKHASNENIGE